LTATTLKVRYRTTAQVLAHLQQLKNGRLFLPTEMPLPCGTQMRLALMLPDGGPAVAVATEVLESIDRKAAEADRKAAGMLLAVTGDKGAVLELERRLAPGQSVAPPPQTTAKCVAPTDSPGPPPSPGSTPPPASASLASLAPTLSMEWLSAALSEAEAVRETEPEPAPNVTSAREQIDLTPAERERIKPVGEFVMDFTKAMLRTGYYASEHPGSEKAKRGLFDAFRNCLSEGAEITITSRETRERKDILITGVLDEPVSVRNLVGAGMAELFVPKLRDAFNRKGIVSLSVRRVISPAHFDTFVRLMSDPKTDRSGEAASGELLTRAMVQHGISEVSLVLLDDLIVLERNLPWRVEMAIQRLAKDLKVLPMFQGETDESIARMKRQIVQDILRPLRRPEFLKDLVVHCHVIARYVRSVRQEDIESALVEGFPLDAMLPTSHLIFKELEHLRELDRKAPGHAAVKQRTDGVKRILKWVARRLVIADVKGAQRFLETLYGHGVLTFEELPADVRYLVNTQRMAEDVATHAEGYLQKIAGASSPHECVTVLKCFRRVLPALAAGGGAADAMLRIASGVKTAAARELIPVTAEIGGDPLRYVFTDCLRELTELYERVEEPQRGAVEALLEALGEPGIEILCRVLADSESRSARKAAMAVLARSGAQVHDWVHNVLEDPTQKWFLKRNALMLLRHVCRGESDIALVRRLFGHTHARVRDEALNTLVQLRTADAELLALKALDDADEKIRWRAVTALGELAPLSAAAMDKLLGRLRAQPPEDRDLAARHQRKVIQVLKAIGGMRAFADPRALEQALLDTAMRAAGRKKSLLDRIRKPPEAEDAAVLGAAVAALGAVGSAPAEAFLVKLIGDKSGATDAAAKALGILRARRPGQPQPA
jgi:HEAT repeat protein